MINLDVIGGVLFFAEIGLASLAGIGLSSRAGWGGRDLAAGLPLAAGLAIAPFLIGFLTILTLIALPGASRSIHISVITAALFGLAAFGLRPLAKDVRMMRSALPFRPGPLTLAALTGTMLLLILAVFTPLTQNDALEFQIVARRIFELRSLSAYPMTDPATEPSGFFAPWTHPPLYPALLYLSEIIQGNADSPALERLIAPWALIVAGVLVACLARLSGVRAGSLAYLALLSPPLVFLGAAGSLIDALTILGFTLAMAFAAAGGGKDVRFSTATGLALGAGMWAHSIAILFPPLIAVAIVNRDWQRTGKFNFRSLSVVLSFAVFSGAWPFLWNIKRYGVAASDAHGLIAPVLLHWDSYFSIDRGLESGAARVVYGLLKMFTAPEAYGLLFLLAGAGALLVIVGSRSLGAGGGLEKTAEPRRSEPAIMALVLMGTFFAGTALSLSFGSIELVKNERYFLVIAPAAAVLAAVFLDWLAVKSPLSPLGAKAGPALARLVLFFAIGLGFTLQFVFVSGYALSRNNLLGSNFGRPFDETLKGRGEFALSYFLRDHTPAGAGILSLKPADMYYAQRRMVSHLDPGMAGFYSAASIEDAAAGLSDMGISFVHMPNYAMPSFYNSWLKEILADPGRSTLLTETSAGQVYQLLPAQLRNQRRLNVNPDSWPWEVADGVVFGSRKRFGHISGRFLPFIGTRLEHDSFWVRAFSRHSYALLRMGENGGAKPVSVAPNSEIVARFVFSGKCHITVFAMEYRNDSNYIVKEERQIGSAIVENQTSPFSFPVRFKPRSTTTDIEFDLLLSGDCLLDMQKSEILEYVAK
jgi:hypothetical protein